MRYFQLTLIIFIYDISRREWRSKDRRARWLYLGKPWVGIGGFFYNLPLTDPFHIRPSVGESEYDREFWRYLSSPAILLTSRWLFFRSYDASIQHKSRILSVFCITSSHSPLWTTLHVLTLPPSSSPPNGLLLVLYCCSANNLFLCEIYLSLASERRRSIDSIDWYSSLSSAKNTNSKTQTDAKYFRRSVQRKVT